MNKPTKVIIHGHFYQPPREDPWTNEIDNQSSAYPYKNWNYRIARECYGPNGYSRVLDEKGMIRDIINNYRYMSFNFGPTLLSWLENKEPDIYQHILEADKLSMKDHGGHGNAIAQIYNHVIMPLQSFEDKKTQIIWGLRDFEYRFGRPSEGIWLSETAVDYKTIDLLIEQKVKFIVLSPLQATAIREAGTANWMPLGKSGINSTVPYKIKRTHGEIAVFFYDRELSTAISFEHLLRNAEDLTYKITHLPGGNTGAVIIATDGEIYGHHEPFGDMCISSMISRFQHESSILSFTNFGEVLEANPPLFEVNLYTGEDGLGSSWSCVHGVGRWYRDCGCKTGGNADWNQKWRTPLRDAFNILKTEIDRIYTDYTQSFIDDPWALRNDYIDFIFSEYMADKNEAFIKQHLTREISPSEKNALFRLLEAEKLALFSFTSCGWFFTEVTGIETVQNIKFASKALHLIEDFGSTIRGKFMEKLAEARSNLSEYKDAAWVFTNWVENTMHDKYNIAYNFITLLRAGKNAAKSDLSLSCSFEYSLFTQKKLSFLSNYLKGSITIIDKTGNTKNTFAFILKPGKGIHSTIYITDDEYESELFRYKDMVISHSYKGTPFYCTFTEKGLLLEVKNTLLELDINTTVKTIYKRSADSIGLVKAIMRKYREIGIGLTTDLSLFIKNTIEVYLHKLSMELTSFPGEELEKELIELFELSNYFDIKTDAVSIKSKFSQLLYDSLSGDTDTESEQYNTAIRFIDFTNRVGIIIEKSKLENRIFDILKNELPAIVDEMDKETGESDKVKLMIKVRRIIMLAEIFNINTTNEKKTFFKSF